MLKATTHYQTLNPKKRSFVCFLLTKASTVCHKKKDMKSEFVENILYKRYFTIGCLQMSSLKGSL